MDAVVRSRRRFAWLPAASRSSTYRPTLETRVSLPFLFRVPRSFHATLEISHSIALAPIMCARATAKNDLDSRKFHFVL